MTLCLNDMLFGQIDAMQHAELIFEFHQFFKAKFHENYRTEDGKLISSLDPLMNYDLFVERIICEAIERDMFCVLKRMMKYIPLHEIAKVIMEIFMHEKMRSPEMLGFTFEHFAVFCELFDFREFVEHGIEFFTILESDCFLYSERINPYTQSIEICKRMLNIIDEKDKQKNAKVVE